jgi:hypothetical protein
MFDRGFVIENDGARFLPAKTGGYEARIHPPPVALVFVPLRFETNS